ncbi:unnamed protein product [Gongylonema pulchrum]|uniref:Uncharacterized protein n=1 Tax=Gongylonema pulchrum TaxID=637853 RepID=A0A183EX90_9BILA|nr:unnamed protein product [Gongylonema pulchrum]
MPWMSDLMPNAEKSHYAGAEEELLAQAPLSRGRLGESRCVAHRPISLMCSSTIRNKQEHLEAQRTEPSGDTDYPNLDRMRSSLLLLLLKAVERVLALTAY